MKNLNQLKQSTHPIILKKGHNLFKEGYVFSFSSYHIFNETVIEASVRGSDSNFYDVSFTLEKNSGIVLKSECSCNAFHTYSGFCKHCVAVTLYYESKSNIRNEEADTNYMLKDLLDKNNNRLLTLIPYEYIGKVKIEPILVYDNHKAYMEFKIGIQQMYVIKDVFQLVDNFKFNKEHTYGKSLSFLHIIDVLDKQSLMYFSLIEKWCNEHEDQYYNFSATKSIEKRVPLNAEYMEHFLLSNKNNSILVEMNYTNRTYWNIKHDAYKPTIAIHEVNGGIELTTTDVIGGVKGMDSYILLKEGCVYFLSKQTLDPVYEFIDCILHATKSTMFISTTDIKKFVNYLLDDLKRVFNVEMNNFDTQPYIFNNPDFKVYLDLIDNNKIKLSAIAQYENISYSIFSEEDESKRNFIKENEFIKTIQPYINSYDEDYAALCIYEVDTIFEFMNEGLLLLHEKSQVYVSEAFKGIRIRKPSKTNVGVSITNDLLSMNVEIENITRDEMYEILCKYETKKRYYKLKNGSFVDIENSGFEQLIQMKNALKINDKQFLKDEIVLPKFRSLFLEATFDMYENLNVHRDGYYMDLIEGMQVSKKGTFEVSNLLNASLKKYQKTGYSWLKTLQKNGFGAILADDMGLGKTIQVIALLCSEYDNALLNRNTLIVTPASLTYNWKNELTKFAPALQVVLVEGDQKERMDLIKNHTNNTILITSYDLLKRDIEHYENEVFAIQVIDEAQYIKNANTIVSKAAKAIHANFKIALTGTPVENKLSEIWSIFDYLMPDYLHSSASFKQLFEIPIIKEEDPYALKQLQKMVTPFILRRKKKDVLKQLPDKIEENKIIPLELEQEKIYRAHVQKLRETIESSDEIQFKSTKIQVLSQLTKLRQICCDPSLLLEGYAKESGKMELCMQLIHTAIEGGHKVLLFSQFTSMLDIIQKRLSHEQISYYSLTGSTSKQKRAQLVDDFNGNDTSVFCISLKAGGTGLNLTSADIVIHFDPWWNSAVQEQATDRAHRIGQKRVVSVYKLIMQNTIEEKIMELQQQKQHLADQILEGDGISSSSFSKEELLDLLTY